MMTKIPPPPPRRASAPAPASSAEAGDAQFTIHRGRRVGAQRVVLYGPGGVGKSELCSLLPGALLLDLEQGSRHLDVASVDTLTTYQQVRDALHSEQLDDFDSIVIDTATKLEELAVAHVIANVPHDKPNVRVTSIEGYGFGKGYRHVYDAMSLILQDLDALARRGKHVVLVAHSSTSTAPNPTGEDWLRYEPRLQSAKRENSVRERVFCWADHVIFVGYDVATTDDGKGRGAGTRTIYTVELPSHVAKTRGAWDPADTVPASMPYEKGDSTIWRLLLGGTR